MEFEANLSYIRSCLNNPLLGLEWLGESWFTIYTMHWREGTTHSIQTKLSNCKLVQGSRLREGAWVLGRSNLQSLIKEELQLLGDRCWTLEGRASGVHTAYSILQC